MAEDKGKWEGEVQGPTREYLWKNDLQGYKPERVHLELEEVNIWRVGHGVRPPALLALPPVRVCGCLAQ